MFGKKQYLSIIQSNSRINIWDGSVRSGKTVASIFRWLKFVKESPKNYPLMMTGKTNKTLERNVLNPLIEIVGPNRAHYTRVTGTLQLLGRKIDIVSANDERAQEKIRGSTLGGMYGDEVSLWPESFFTMALSRISLKGAKFFGTTNPDSPYHWLKTGYIDRRHELNLSRFHFVLEDNEKNLDPDYIVQLKREYTGLWYKRFIDGLWVLAEGVIYDMWDDKQHVVKGEPKEFKNYIVGVDYGTSNPTVFELIGFNNNRPPAHLVKEYHWDGRKEQRQKTDSEYADDLVKFIKGKRVLGIYIDPSAASFIAECRKRGLNVISANNSVLDGIRFVGTLLAKKGFYVHESCEKTIEEVPGYVWDEKAAKNGEDKPVKANDHCLDACRYALFTHFYREHNLEIIGFNYD